jgi:serine/threonine protein kinase
VKRPIPFGKYYLLERINVGGMAEVFKAKTFGVEGFERLLAVKRILPNIAADAEFIEMFIDEAKIAVQLNHANIAQIFDLGKVEESFFIALEYVHGKDLRAIFDRCRALKEAMPISQSCFIMMKVCEGLDYAHNKRDSAGREMHLVHRDVSPQNVLISYEGEVKLVDFGIAKAAGKASKTQAGILKGKFGYMSPEQVRGLPLDRRSDIFSMGIVLYELLTGERLFTGESDFSTLEKVRNVEILPPSAYNRKIPEQLEQIVLKALSKDVEDRYQNAIDLHDDLQAFMYTSGEFYSRKDLAGWMKRTFAREIEEEGRKLEEYRQLPPPPPTSGQPRAKPPAPPVPSGGNGKGLQFGPPKGLLAQPTENLLGPRPGAAATPSLGGGEPVLSWDDEEIETQIYDKPGGPVLPGMAKEQARPQGATLDQPTMEVPVRKPAHTGPQTPPPLLAPDDRPPPLVPRAPAHLSTVPVLAHAPAAVEPRHNRLVLWLTVALLTTALCGGVIYYFLVATKRPGSLSVVASPVDADLYLDGKKQPGVSPFTVRSLKPGYYIVSVARPGYQRWTRTVEIRPREALRLSPKLEPMASATIELRTVPREAEAYLDGRKLSGQTPMRISQITPGRHKLEVRKATFQSWVHELDIHPDQVLQLNARLLPLEVAVRISSEPRAMAYLEQDGSSRELGLTPVEVRVTPSTKVAYQVSVKKEGYRVWTRPLSFEGASPPVLRAVLEKQEITRPAPVPPKKVVHVQPRPQPKPRPRPKVKVEPKKVVEEVEPPPHQPKPESPQPTGMGTLLINSNPATMIIIDGKETGLWVPQKKIPLPAGKHTITLRNPKFNIDESFPITIKPGQPTRVIKNFSVGAQP